MGDLEIRIEDESVTPAQGWRFEMIDPARGIGRLVNGAASVPVLVEGSASDWVVTIRGRRIPVTVRSWRERMLVGAETAATGRGGRAAVKATLPGLILTVAVSVGDIVDEGGTLLTIEAMKMQNDVRAPRSGRVIEVSVRPGETVTTGTLLIRLE
ncbi:MAG: hypothetical protein M3492_06705 [Actinomycetota bacterium]|nr:hypothetical protein [Actinomycetota bacterium]